MTKEELAKIKLAIEVDIDNGVYNNFIVLKEKLQRIVHKIYKLQIIINASQLSHHDIQLLKDNDYIK